MAALNRSPAPAPGRLAVLGALLVLGVSVLGGPVPVLASFVGFVLIVVGTKTGGRRVITGGAGFLLASTLASGVRGAWMPAVAVATIGTVLAWDMGRTAIDMGHQLGTEAVATRPAVVHAAGTLLAGGSSAAVAYGVYLSMGEGQPALAVVLLLLTVILLVLVQE